MTYTKGLQPEVVLEHRCLLGEGPVWDAKRKTICWIDILNGLIHQYSPGEKKHNAVEVHQMIGSFAFCTDGNIIAALQNGFAFIDRETGEIKMIADPESHLPNNRFNEGKCDPAGRFWAGTMAFSEMPGAGNLYAMHKDLQQTKKIKAVTVSNGMAWSADYKTFYYIDSPTRRVVAYDYDNPSGHISNKRTIIKIAKQEGFPDGMTIDNEGMLWIAHWDGWQVTRWDPESGKKLYSVKMPVAKVTSCTFGGEDFTDLYITSAKIGLAEDALIQQPLAGSLFVLPNLPFKGARAFEFVV
ncbi:MAG TPA: SMP-30/gluconolactonase/LRE family protein [Puia sp.]|nr:SMP-30/gluconolactonase/LRE family protein [Puia sp.]